jgi:signal transduction histidine kinase
MAGRTGRDQEAGGTAGRSFPALRSLLAATAIGGMTLPAAADVAALAGAAEALAVLPPFDLHNAASLALWVSPIVVATASAILLLRDRRISARRDRRLRAEVARLRASEDRAQLLVGSERQFLVTWSGRDGEVRFEGDPTVAGEGATVKRVLAFGGWLTPADAAAVEGAIEQLKGRGEAFRLTARTLAHSFVDVEGRTVGGQAILRLRDVTGDRSDLLRARAELAAVRSDLRTLTALVDSIDHPLWMRDAKDQLVFANQAYLRAVEAASIADAAGRSLELLDRPTRDEASRRRAGGSGFDARVSAVIRGQRHVLDVAERPTPIGGASVAIDVSELESIQADLKREMEAHVRTLDQLPTAVAIFDGRQRLAFANTAYQRLWGLDPAFLAATPTDSEVLDRLRSLRKLPEQADFRQWKADVLAGYRAVEPHETWWHLPDRRTLRVVMNPNPQGGVTYLFDDVSERVQLESKVTAITRVQSETLDTLKEGVAVFGTDGRLKLSNRAFMQMWQLSADALADHPHIDALIRVCRLLAPQDEPWAEISGAVAGLNDMRLGLSCRMQRRDGSAIDCTAQPLPDGATLLTFVDMTASVSVERALTERNDALERASRLRDDFVHHVSYELRSPLTNIIGFTQLLGDETVGALNPRQRDYAGHIMRSSAALLAILNDILDLASIDTGSLELLPEVVEILPTIEAAMRGLEDRIAEASLSVVIDAPDDIGSFVADGKRVRQILFNLLSNAVGFSLPGQTIVVSARKTPNDVILEVRDQGRGMPPDVADRVFERFESHTDGTRHRGVGLGLSIVRSFVELHGGRVDLASSPGLGTTVTCTFPYESHQSPFDGRAGEARVPSLAAE